MPPANRPINPSISRRVSLYMCLLAKLVWCMNGSLRFGAFIGKRERMQSPNRVLCARSSSEFREATQNSDLSLPVIKHHQEGCACISSQSRSMEGDKENFIDSNEARCALSQESDTWPSVSTSKSNKRKHPSSSHRHSASTSSTTGSTTETIRFDDIVGHDSVKMRIHELLLSVSPTFSNVMMGVRAIPASVLLHGPPGCGKTKLARAIAGEARAAFLPISPSDILSKYVGESESRVRDVFSEAWEQAAALESRCAVLFFDEIDSLGLARGGGGSTRASSDGCAGLDGGPAASHHAGEGSSSRRVLAELLLQLNIISDLKKTSQTAHPPTFRPLGDANAPAANVEATNRAQILVVAATNRPQDCDPALLRRFGIRLFVGPPTKTQRKRLLLKLLRGVPCTMTRDDFACVAEETEGWSGSDLESLAREAAMAPVRECIRSAMLFRKAMRRKCRNDVSDHSEAVEVRYPEYLANEFLENCLRTVRPVVIQDFLRAIEFWLYNGQSSDTGASLPHESDENDNNSSDED